MLQLFTWSHAGELEQLRSIDPWGNLRGRDEYELLPLGGKPAQDGTWYAVLDVDDKLFERYAHARDQSLGSWSARMAHGVRYSLNAHALSNLRMDARVSQNSLELGATLTEYGIPVEHRATVRAELQRPDGTQTTLFLVEGESGVFQASTVAPIQGV